MGLIFSTLYNLAITSIQPPPVSLTKKIRDQINFMLMHCGSTKLNGSLLDMRSSDGFNKLSLNNLYGDLTGPNDRQVDKEATLQIMPKFIIAGMKESRKHKEMLCKNLTTYRQDLDNHVTDKLIETLKSDLDQHAKHMIAQAYMCMVIATESLGTKNPEWKKDFQYAFDCQTCADDLKDDHQTYKDIIKEFRKDNKDNVELVKAVDTVFAYLEPLLPQLKPSGARPT